MVLRDRVEFVLALDDLIETGDKVGVRMRYEIFQSDGTAILRFDGNRLRCSVTPFLVVFVQGLFFVAAIDGNEHLGEWRVC